jgi:uncharacterized membrane protein YdjX (TVP38/TMEM64 family)
MAILVAGVWLLRSGRLGSEWTPAALRARFEGGVGPLAPLVYVAALAILTNLMVPASLLVTSAGIVFGWKVAFLYSLPGSVAAHLVGYLLSALLLRNTARRILERLGWLGILERFEQKAPLRMAFLARFIPIPVGAQNYLLGLTRIPLVPYLVGSLVGALPWLFVFTQLGATAGLPMRPPFLFGVACYVLLVYAADWWWHSRRREGER